MARAGAGKRHVYFVPEVLIRGADAAGRRSWTIQRHATEICPVDGCEQDLAPVFSLLVLIDEVGAVNAFALLR
jgi:hypothetical protein